MTKGNSCNKTFSLACNTRLQFEESVILGWWAIESSSCLRHIQASEELKTNLGWFWNIGGLFLDIFIPGDLLAKPHYGLSSIQFMVFSLILMLDTFSDVLWQLQVLCATAALWFQGHWRLTHKEGSLKLSSQLPWRHPQPNIASQKCWAPNLPPRPGAVWVRQRVLPLLVDSLLHSPLVYILQELRFPDSPSGPKFKHNRALGARETIQMHIRMTLLDCKLDRVWVTIGMRVSWWGRLTVGGTIPESIVRLKENIAASIWVCRTSHPDYGRSVWSTVSQSCCCGFIAMMDCVLKDWVEESLVKLLSFYSVGSTIYFSFLLIFKIHSLDIFFFEERNHWRAWPFYQ